MADRQIEVFPSEIPGGRPGQSRGRITCGARVLQVRIQPCLYPVCRQLDPGSPALAESDLTRIPLADSSALALSDVGKDIQSHLCRFCHCDICARFSLSSSRTKNATGFPQVDVVPVGFVMAWVIK